MKESFFKNIKHNHKYIIFLSELTIENLKCCNCGYDKLRKKHLRNFYNLYETEELLTIISANNINFVKEQLFFDDIDNHYPRRDCLYIKINSNYYISYENYLENITKFSFTLYSSLFSKFGLKKINCHISKSTFKNRKVSNNLDIGVGKLNILYDNKNDSNVVELKSEEFNINPDNMNNIMSFRKLKFYDRKNKIIEYIPRNYDGNNIMFYKSINMNNINKVIDENVSKLIYSFELKKNEIKNIYVGLGESYTPLNITNNFNYELECKEEQFVKFYYEFYTLEDMKTKLVELKKIKSKMVSECNTKEFFLSNSKNFQGPWPSACKKIKTHSGIRTFNGAIDLSKKLILEDPKNTVNEIRFDMGFLGLSYSVHNWKLTNHDIDITYGPPTRHLHFHNIAFKQRNRLIALLRKHGF